MSEKTNIDIKVTGDISVPTRMNNEPGDTSLDGAVRQGVGCRSTL